MKKKAGKNCFFVVFLLFFSSQLLATAEEDFTLGVESFKVGDNESAVMYFELAMQQGMDSVSLHYNLASSYYKLGKYEEAKKYFNHVYKTKAMKDLAEYNLGLIALKQKKGNTAIKYFNSIVNTGKDKKLIRLSEKQLVAINKSKPEATKKEKRLSAYVSTHMGYDNNISSVSSDSVLDISDTFFDVYMSANYLLDGNRYQGWIADASYYQIDFEDTESNDEYLYSFGLKRTLELDDWDTSAHVSLSKTIFAGDDYQSALKLDLKGRKKIAKSQYLYLRYRIEDIVSDISIYDYLEGWRHRARVEYRQYSSRNIKQFYYELELNDRGTLETSTYAYDYSPTRHTLRGVFTQIMDKNWRLHGDLQYRLSDYPSSSTVNRDDDQLKLALSAEYRFDRTFKLTSKIQFTDNASTEDRYSYDKCLIKIGLSKSF